MISEAELAHWRSVVPWLERSQVEQHLVLDVAAHRVRGRRLHDDTVWRCQPSPRRSAVGYTIEYCALTLRNSTARSTSGVDVTLTE